MATIELNTLRETSKLVMPFSQCVKDIRNGRGGILFNTDQVLPHVRNPLSALDILANSLTPTGGLSLSFHSKLVDGDLEKKKSENENGSGLGEPVSTKCNN